MFISSDPAYPALDATAGPLHPEATLPRIAADIGRDASFLFDALADQDATREAIARELASADALDALCSRVGRIVVRSLCEYVQS
jgi:hypothetical protein